MVATLKAGNIDGFCAGEPWNAHAVSEGIGFIVANDLELWPGHPEKVLGVREAWANQYPQTHLALVKALMEACEYCDDRRNRAEIAELLARPDYVGAELDLIRAGFVDPYDRGDGKPPESLLRFNQFHIDMTNCPNRAEGLWILTQLARWGITPFPKNWIEILDRVRRMDVYREAARELEMPDTEPNRGPITLFDGTVFDPDDPIGYLNSLPIKREISIVEVDLDAPVTGSVAAPVAV
jgi:nitrate/nitrite transport system ATP-binding protein